jgi:uncharacterized protein
MAPFPLARRAFLAAVLVFCLARPGVLSAQDLDPAFRADIVKLMDVLGTAKLAHQASSAVTQQMQQAIKAAHPDTPDRVFEVVRQVSEEELTKAFDGPNSLISQMVPLYAKYFTHDDIKGMLAYYDSDLGKKAIAAMPALLQDSMKISKAWAAAANPRIRAAINERLKAEGIPAPR